ncbi:hypothetical protein M408DRAFT_253933 [Serendipita vermifera MAFF 305830]|uniref:Uncharacterized protein n=1 Tax=Serendipita vermifera MAFF 305830 TaxID=933852 RepID=A0A0C3BG62_SERVB|nr:hypothetical protein M408DRAFT_253933 [Serendipita vermifera MAFF 305830]
MNSLSDLPEITMSSVLIDDLPTIFPSDSRIVYRSQQWTPSISCGLNSMATAELGATWTFNFTGSAIWIYTATSQQGGNYTVDIDGNNMGILDTIGSTCKIEASYHIGNLANSAHLISLTSIGASASSTGEINFVGLRLSPSVDQSTGTRLEGGVNKAAIAGGVIGVVAALTLFATVIYLYLRWKQHLKTRIVTETTDNIVPLTFPGEPSNPVLNEKRQLGANNANVTYQSHAKPPLPGWADVCVEGSHQDEIVAIGPNEANISNQPMMYQSHTKPPVPYWALTISHQGSAENLDSHQDDSGSFLQPQLAPLYPLPDGTSASNQPTMYQLYTKPSIPYWANTAFRERLTENVNSRTAEPGLSLQHQTAPLHPSLGDINTSNQNMAYLWHTKPPVPYGANAISQERSTEDVNSCQAEPGSSPQSPLDETSTSNQPTMYQWHTKPSVPYWALTTPQEGSTQNADLHRAEPGPSLQHQRAPLHTPPPSFRTRPFSDNNSQGRARDTRSLYSTTFPGVSNDNPHPFGPSTGEGPSSVVHDDECSSAPPYVEDVLARPDARNLSENDVDTIARRLAEVMRVQDAARGGPGLLAHNERSAPPRELIDRFVGEHLGRRENIS